MKWLQERENKHGNSRKRNDKNVQKSMAIEYTIESPNHCIHIENVLLEAFSTAIAPVLIRI